MKRSAEVTEVLAEVTPVRRASRQLVRELGFLEHRLSPQGPTHTQCHALIELGARGNLTAGELAELLNLDKSTTSRSLAGLQKQGLVTTRADQEGDARRKPLALTAKGRRRLETIHEHANAQVHAALGWLSPEQRGQVVRGLELYAQALMRARLREGLVVRPLARKDDAQVAAVIREVMTELGASGPGFAIHDPEVQAMSRAYSGPRARYFVVERDGRVLGGGGFAPLAGGDEGICELRKMYFRPELRGLGVGAELLDLLLAEAARAGYRTCYLETLKSMVQARRLYEAKGFAPIERPLGATGHFGCDAWYVRPLETEL